MTDNRATELREKLDELGIKHFDFDRGGRTQTTWESPDGKRHITYETVANPAKTAKRTASWFFPSEQVITVTPRSEQTCKMMTNFEIRNELGIIDAPEDTWGYMCNVCGWSFRYNREIKPNFCPGCGRKVVN